MTEAGVVECNLNLSHGLSEVNGDSDNLTLRQKRGKATKQNRGAVDVQDPQRYSWRAPVVLCQASM